MEEVEEDVVEQVEEVERWTGGGGGGEELSAWTEVSGCGCEKVTTNTSRYERIQT